jgi:hypothetical protein
VRAREIGRENKTILEEGCAKRLFVFEECGVPLIVNLKSPWWICDISGKRFVFSETCDWVLNTRIYARDSVFYILYAFLFRGETNYLQAKMAPKFSRHLPSIIIATDNTKKASQNQNTLRPSCSLSHGDDDGDDCYCCCSLPPKGRPSSW